MENLIKISPQKAEQPDTQCKLVTIAVNPEAKKIIGKKVHDITSSLRALTFAVESIEEGYRFDDDLAEAKIASMKKAVSQLQKEFPLICEILTV
jgi:hypothetical protein